MPRQPMAEVFGYPIDNTSAAAQRGRDQRLCPFHNRVAACTKDSIARPLGVCSVYDGAAAAITCPIRFRQDWIITQDAAAFFFPVRASWTYVTEVRLYDSKGGSAGNIDIVLVDRDAHGQITDFGALEVQAVYISGNVRNPFEHYLQDPGRRFDLDWTGQKHYPRADYLSSSRKRLAPQLIYKGGILRSWGKKLAVALNSGFYAKLPTLPEVDKSQADMAWFAYDLRHDPRQNVYTLALQKTVYTQFLPALERITQTQAGSAERFVRSLEEKLRKR